MVSIVQDPVNYLSNISRVMCGQFARDASGVTVLSRYLPLMLPLQQLEKFYIDSQI